MEVELKEFIIALVYNASLLIVLYVAYEQSYNVQIKQKKLMQVINGFFIGAIGIAIMAAPFTLVRGIVFDTRSILISSAAFIFGPVPAVITVVMTSVFRILQGGAGTLMGVAVILFSAAIGLLWRLLHNKRKPKNKLLNLYVFGFIVHAVMIGCTVFLPGDMIVFVVKQISIPVMIVYPVFTVLLCSFLINQKEFYDNRELLVQTEEKFRSLVEKSPDAIYIITDDKFVFMNNATIDLFGAESNEQLLGISIFDVIDSDFHEEVNNRIEKAVNDKKKSLPMEEKCLRLDGSTVYADVASVPIQYLGKQSVLLFARDTSARKSLQLKNQKLEQIMRQNQKLESIGLLAGGVAHEINNPLNGIMNYAQLIIENPGEDSDSIGYAGEIVSESERISAIVKNLLQFSRMNNREFSYSKIEDIISRTCSLIKSIFIKEQIELKIRYDKNLPDIKCNSQQLQQVFMNLITNSRDALNEKYPKSDRNKVIEIDSSNIKKGDKNWIKITVKDCGNGIPANLKEKVFEPFFSTKECDMGTGLGLSISYGIIQDHKGLISFDSKSGEYTKFIIEVPVEQ